MRCFSLDLFGNSYLILPLPFDKRVFDRNLYYEIFVRVFICVSLQPRNITTDRLAKSSLEVLFVSDPDS